VSRATPEQERYVAERAEHSHAGEPQ
jgi:hypothetical protein